LTSINEKLWEDALRINMLDVAGQQNLLDRLFQLWDDLDSRKRSAVLSSLRECFFRAMTKGQKKWYLSALAEHLPSAGPQTGDFIELLGQLMKYAEFDVQALIGQVLDLAETQQTPKAQICGINFCKYVWDACGEKNRGRIAGLLQNLSQDQNSDLAEIAEDVLYGIHAKPICHEQAQIALVIPEFLTSATFLQQPLDFMTVVSILNRNGIQADIVDNRVHNYSLSRLGQLLRQYKTVIITSSPVDMSQKYYVDFRYCIFCQTVNSLREQLPGVRIAVCGAHGTVDKDLLQADICCDAILSGESTRAVADYLLETPFDEDAHDPLQLDAVDMKWYYGRKMVGQTTYRQKQYSIFQLSQGCPYQCVFCFNIYGRHVRRMPLDTAITQLRSLVDAGVRHIFFIDQTFTLDRDYVKALCREMQEQGFNLTWQCETRADLIDESVVSAMKAAGCKAIWLGFESFSQEVLDANKKHLTCQQQLDAVRIINNAGVHCSGFVMLGMVADTKQTIQQTIDTIVRHKIPTSRTANLCTVRIGTQLYDRAKAEGLIQVGSFCHLEAYRGQLFNDLSEEDLVDSLHRFSSQLG